ncbi:MAG: carboxypeptidase regulatory-like domain-containing protein, partial [Oscillospiraceae bacterium]|nr:carboxypeptidase regulatory-like domain-containing protein [Oscillospiraceae bacterium]
MKAVKILVCTLLIAVMAFGGPIGALAEEAEQEAAAFPAADREMIENFTDSEKLPIRSELSEFYGQTKNEDADVIESMISDEAKAEFSASIDAAADFEPVKDEEVSLVLGRVENFLSSGGLKAYLENENLLMGSEIGLTRNREEKVKVLGSDSNASGWVFVVDKDAMSWWVTDSEGMGIPNALVTISYLDESGRRVTKSTPATAGNTPGIAVFDELPEYFFGLVDIQAQGYHAVSILDKKMGKGEHYTISLSEAKENEIYIRGVDLGGKDMVNEETRL